MLQNRPVGPVAANAPLAVRRAQVAVLSDWCLLTVGFFAALRRELARLPVDHLELKDPLWLLVTWSKADQTGAGRRVELR
ncbi:site-specific integrase [Micromonospora aurantiaca (nom. illeg.)]|uniref:hypothetical protein n=1 Tax=Micromonospora aurantiaca (nom. illeg.) TaxID=47850 RepID=UPI001656DD99|nr:hypothetical protein [Micromonospora aurantiaca]MBC9005074.1 hypothetical protein [Micromonospora aurantiaca]